MDPSGIGFDLDVPLEVVIGSIPFARVAQQYGEVITQQPTAPPSLEAPDGLYTSSKTGEVPGITMPNLRKLNSKFSYKSDTQCFKSLRQNAVLFKTENIKNLNKWMRKKCLLQYFRSHVETIYLETYL